MKHLSNQPIVESANQMLNISVFDQILASPSLETKWTLCSFCERYIKYHTTII